MIFRCYFGSMYRHRAFSGDPHPGNSLLLDDGRMAFIDFGLFKRISDEAAESELAMARAGIEGRGEELIELMADAGMLRDPERATPDGVIAQFRGYTWWFTTDEVLELDPTLATRIVLDFADPTTDQFRRVRHETLPRRAHLRAPRGDDDAGRHEPAAPARQLVPDRARVDLRRRAADGARAGRGRLLRAAPLMERRSRDADVDPRHRPAHAAHDARRSARCRVHRSWRVSGLALDAHGRELVRRLRLGGADRLHRASARC